MKKCAKCLQTKPADTFNRHARSADGLQSWCRACSIEYTKRWSKDNPARRNQSRRDRYKLDPATHIEYSRRHTIKRKYGLTLEEYEVIVARGCAICGATVDQRLSDGRREIHLDHDHVSGRVRDALCTRCNRGLGCFTDDPERLRAAADYLEKHGIPIEQVIP